MLDHLQHPHHGRTIETEPGNFVHRHVFLDKRLEDRVEDRVIGQRVAVLLVWPEFGGRLARYGALGDGLTQRVAITREPVDQRLAAVLDRRKTARHVAVQRRITDRHLALVAGRQQHAARLVGYRHQDHAAAAGLDVLLRDVGLATREDRLELLHRRVIDRRDRHDVIAKPHGPGLSGGVFLADRAGVAERHHDRPDLVGADRIAGDRGNQRRIDAA